MRTIFKYMLLAAVAPFIASCSNDDDDNPVLHVPESFVLNVPEYAENNIYDLQYGSAIELTTSQPDYGYTAPTSYSVQVTVDEAFVEDTEETSKNYVTLPTTYNTAKMYVDKDEMASALIELLGDDVPSEPIPVAVRLMASITNTGRGTCYSNAITLPRVKVFKPVATIALPETMFFVGAMPNSNWGKWLPMAQANQGGATAGTFYGVFYFTEGCNFKFGPEDGNWDVARTYDSVTYTDNAVALAGVQNGDDSGNSKVGNAGWYVVVVYTKIVKNEVQYTVDFRKPVICLIGNTTGSSWDFADEWQFSVPDTWDGEFVSPAMTGSGEVRMAINAGEQWWTTEFTLCGGAIYHREQNNIVSNWADDLGAEYSVQGSAGQTIHLNFSDNTGHIE